MGYSVIAAIGESNTGMLTKSRSYCSLGTASPVQSGEAEEPMGSGTRRPVFKAGYADSGQVAPYL